MKNKIRLERARLGLTQEDLAKKVNVSRQTINSIETGRYVPSTVLALKIARVFQCQVNDIFELDEEELPE